MKRVVSAIICWKMYSKKDFFSCRDMYISKIGKMLIYLLIIAVWAVNPSYIRSWLDFLSTTPRGAPFLSKNDPLITALKKVMILCLALLHDYDFLITILLCFDELLFGLDTLMDMVSSVRMDVVKERRKGKDEEYRGDKYL